VEGGGEEPSANVFPTPSGKFEFAATALDRAGVKIGNDKDYLPHFSPVEPEGDPASYPLILVPTELTRLPSGDIGNPPFCTKTLEESELKKGDVLVEINPKTAEDCGLGEGACAELATPKGKNRVLVHLSEGIMPGLIGIPKGLGHQAYDDYLAGKGVDVNSLMGVTEDPVSGLCATWGVRAKLTRV
jgi:anaerobic selenocysteine-containing dehydrogenase